MDALLIGLGIILLIIVIIAVVVLLTSTTKVIPQEQRYVIYRLGRFHRIAGPGPVQILPKLDKVVRTIEVRDHPTEITVPGIFAFGIPSELTLNVWYRTDLLEAAQGDKNRLARLVAISEAERRQQVEVKMREALTRQIAKLQAEKPLPDKASFTERMAALAPASPRYNDLIEGVKQELEGSLPTIGVILNKDHSIVLTRRTLSDEITKAIKRRQGREIDSEFLTKYVDNLRAQFPGLSPTLLTQMLASIEGIDIGKVQRLFLDRENIDSEVEVEMSGEGNASPNVVAKAFKEARGSSSPTERSHTLTKNDLSVLKRVPDRGQEELSA